MTPLIERLACRTGRYLHNSQQTQEEYTSTPSAGLEPAIPAIERPKNCTLDRAATGIGNILRPIRNKSARINLGVSVSALTQNGYRVWLRQKVVYTTDALSDGLDISYGLHQYQFLLSFSLSFLLSFFLSFSPTSYLSARRCGEVR